MTNTFADFEYYRDEYGGTLSEQQFKQPSIVAFSEIISETMNRAANAPDSMTEALKLCQCELADLIYAQNTVNEELPPGISSVTNDKYSVSRDGGYGYVQLKRDRRAICERWLSSPINLLNRWI